MKFDFLPEDYTVKVFVSPVISHSVRGADNCSVTLMYKGQKVAEHSFRCVSSMMIPSAVEQAVKSIYDIHTYETGFKESAVKFSGTYNKDGKIER